MTPLYLYSSFFLLQTNIQTNQAKESTLPPLQIPDLAQLAMDLSYTLARPTYIYRSQTGEYLELEKRQLFLRSYQFSRKRSFADKFNTSLFRVKRVILHRLKSAKKLRKILVSKVKKGLFLIRRRRFFLRLRHRFCQPFFFPFL